MNRTRGWVAGAVVVIVAADPHIRRLKGGVSTARSGYDGILIRTQVAKDKAIKVPGVKVTERAYGDVP